MSVFLTIAGFAGGYVAAIYSWPKVKVFCNGAQAAAKALRAKAEALLAAIRKR